MSKIEPIYLVGIPVPPSVNAQYATIIRHGRPIRIPSKTAKDYERAFAVWELQNRALISKARGVIRGWGQALEVSMILALRRDRLVTKDGRLKRLDISNRAKAIHDLIATSLGVDDCCFISTPMEKVIADICDEQLVIIVKPMSLRNMSKVDLFDEPSKVVQLSCEQVLMIQKKLPVA